MNKNLSYIANDNDQEMDLFNDLIRALPERKRTNKVLLDKLRNVLNNCVYLKVNFSKKDDNNEIYEPKFKTDMYKS